MPNFENVPCYDRDDFVTAMTWTQAKAALTLCSGCPVRRDCLDFVDPLHNWSDGVIGGYLWLNGKPMTKEYERQHPLLKPFADHETLAAYLASHE